MSITIPVVKALSKLGSKLGQNMPIALPERWHDHTQSTDEAAVLNANLNEGTS